MLMNRVVIVACLAVMLGLTSHPAAQSAAGPRFEVASIKPSDPNAVGPFGKGVLPEARVVGGRYIASNHTLRDLVKIAYDFWFDFRIDGGPDWLTSRRFDIQAKAEDAAADMGAMRPMIRALLADRFKLKVHTETREMPISRSSWRAMTAGSARTSSRRPPTAPTRRKCRAKIWLALFQAGRVPCAITPMPTRVAGSTALRGNGASMAALAQFLWGPTGRIVHDRTGLSGLYDWEMTYDRAGYAGRPQTCRSPRRRPTARC